MKRIMHDDMLSAKIATMIIEHALSVDIGDRLTLVCENDRLVLMNSAIFALREFQKSMEGEAEKAGITSDNDVAELIMQMRRGDDE